MDVGQARWKLCSPSFPRSSQAQRVPTSLRKSALYTAFVQRCRPGAPLNAYDTLLSQVFLKNKLKYALTGREVTLIVAQRLVKVDGKVRTDNNYPAGFMGAHSLMKHVDRRCPLKPNVFIDVISIDKSGEHFRLLYDVKGRFAIHRISPEEAKCE